ncbi:hypothetical protein GGR57DRAFT_496847 [Xylariaceae sp. FL1272]|nr:hypothetical protein GGR57DRAFT_496847 [Xylariaceae sp. FL1272]
MKVPNYTVVPVTEDDIPVIGTFLQHSKLQLAINRFVIQNWPNEQFQKTHYKVSIEFLQTACRNPLHSIRSRRVNLKRSQRLYTTELYCLQLYQQKAVKGGLADPQSTTLKVINIVSGLPVAHLVYTRAKTLTDSGDNAEGPIETPPGIVPEVYAAVVNAIGELKPSLDSEEYIDLTHIYVEPSSRGKGIGSELVKIAYDVAKEAGLPFSICAEPNFHSFFVNRGFRDVKHVDIDLTRWAAPTSGYGAFRLSRMVIK